MSICGKMDFYDLLVNIKTHRLFPGNENSPLVGDIFEGFEDFKERTGGYIYQKERIEVSLINQDYVKELCPSFKIEKHIKVEEDRRHKDKNKLVTYYLYKYLGKEFNSLKELNKYGVYVNKPIKFETLVDLIPYFPYIVACHSYSRDSYEFVCLSSESYIDQSYHDSILYGNTSAEELNYTYRKRLADIARHIILKEAELKKETKDE